MHLQHACMSLIVDIVCTTCKLSSAQVSSTAKMMRVTSLPLAWSSCTTRGREVTHVIFCSRGISTFSRVGSRSSNSMRICVCACVRARPCVCVCVCVRNKLAVCTTLACPHTSLFHAIMLVRTHTHVCMHTRARTHTHTHTHTHVRTHTFSYHFRTAN